MDTLSGFYPESPIPLHEWECLRCGQLLELPSEDNQPRLCEECEEAEEEEES